MRRPLVFLALFSLPAGLRAQEAETPILIFREADAETAREITRDLITSKGLGDNVPRKRLEARERLARIGPWSVPFLADTLAGGRGSSRIRMNAALSLAILRDPRGLDALRRAAAADEDAWVRRAATLAIGLFQSGRDVDTLRGLLTSPRGGPRYAAPALAKLRHPKAAAILVASAQPDVLPRSEHDRAAVLLAATIAAPGVSLVEHLEHDQRLVQEAAATGLTLRPLPASRAGEILAALRRTRLTGGARVIAIRALGAMERDHAVHAALLDIGRRDGASEERIAALMELDGRAEDFEALRKAYRLLQGRNDPVVAALLLAIARTHQPAAFDDLLGLMRGGSDFVRFYAGASLLFVSAFDDALDAETRLRLVTAVGSLTGERDAYLGKLGEAANVVKWALQKPTLPETARNEFRKLGDPRDLRLFIWTREERTWREVNRLVARILQLDQVLVQFDSARPGRTAEPVMGGGEGGEEGRKAPSGTNEEQDLFDLLLPPPPPPAPKGEPDYPERPPYFGPEDLGG